MSKARIMGAGSSGFNYGANKNSPGNGNGKWQGLWPSVGHARNTRYINVRAGGNNRNVVFCVNQLAGVGRISNMFAPTADGVAGCVEGPYGFVGGKFGPLQDRVEGKFNLLESLEKVDVSDVGLGLFWEDDHDKDLASPTSVFVAWTGHPFRIRDETLNPYIDFEKWNSFKDTVLVLPQELKDWGTNGKGAEYVNSVFGGIENYRLAFVNLLTILPANSPGNADDINGAVTGSGAIVISAPDDNCRGYWSSYLPENGNGLNNWHGGCFYDDIPDFTKSPYSLTDTEKKLWTRWPIRVSKAMIDGGGCGPDPVKYDLSKGSVVPPCKNSMLCNKGIVLLFLRDKYYESVKTTDNPFPELKEISLFNPQEAESIERSYNNMKTTIAKGPDVQLPTKLPFCKGSLVGDDPGCKWSLPDWKSGPLGAWGMPFDAISGIGPSKGYTVTAYAESDCPCAAK